MRRFFPFSLGSLARFYLPVSHEQAISEGGWMVKIRKKMEKNGVCPMSSRWKSPQSAHYYPAIPPLFRCKEETTTTGKDIACQDSSLGFFFGWGFWRTTKWKVFQITTHRGLEWVGGTRRGGKTTPEWVRLCHWLTATAPPGVFPPSFHHFLRPHFSSKAIQKISAREPEKRSFGSLLSPPFLSLFRIFLFGFSLFRERNDDS